MSDTWVTVEVESIFATDIGIQHLLTREEEESDLAIAALPMTGFELDAFEQARADFRAAEDRAMDDAIFYGITPHSTDGPVPG